MQTLVDIPEAQIEALNTLSKARNQTPAEFIAEVLSGILTQSPLGPAETLSWHTWMGSSTSRRSAPSGTVNGTSRGTV